MSKARTGFGLDHVCAGKREKRAMNGLLIDAASSGSARCLEIIVHEDYFFCYESIYFRTVVMLFSILELHEMGKTI